MDRHEPRDLDAVIDDVAGGMTSAGLRRDLRPAVAARIADAPSWRSGWRSALAASAAVVIVLAALLLRLGPEQNRAPAAANAGQPRALSSAPQSFQAVAALEAQSSAPLSTARPVARQLVDDTPVVEQVVQIDPVAIVPLEDEAVGENTLLSQRVEIAPIDVERLSISQLEEVE